MRPLEIVSQAVAARIVPSLGVLATQDHKVLCRSVAGPQYKIYDVASLTKILVTTPLVMILHEQKKLNLNEKVSTYLPYLGGSPAGGIILKDLLCHYSGLLWWRPYFKELTRVSPCDRVAVLKHKFRFEKKNPQAKCVYSDLDFILLGWVIEELTQMGLDEAAQTLLFNPLGLSPLTFFVRETGSHGGSVGRGRTRDFAPTLKAGPRGLVQGVAMDDNAWSMGGVAGHAGLFSTLSDVSRMGNIFLDSYLGNSRAPWSPKTMKLFARRAVSKNRGDWGLGFSLPTPPASNAGTRVSANSFGHWAFTGPSLWIDPRRRTVVTIVANRTFPQYKDQAKYKKFLLLRRQIHDEIWGLSDAANSKT